MTQREYIGVGSLASLRDLLRELTPRKILIVAGETSFGASGASERLAPVLAAYEVEMFNSFSSNPSLPDIKRCIESIHRFQPDCVVAIGGGSALDVAKAANVLAVQTENPESYVLGKNTIGSSGKPLIAIPTTAGTGSEATHFAVVYIDTSKYSLAHASMLPYAAIVDASLTASTPPHVAASAGMDALAQAVESMWSKQSTEESKAYAKDAIPLLIAHLVRAVKGDTASREAVARAAHLAGKAINISKTTASHAMSYPMTAHFRVSHGHAVALTLSQVLQFNAQVTESDCIDPRGAAYVRTTIEEVRTLLGGEKVIGEIMEALGLKKTLSELGVDERHLPTLLAGISEERMGNNPRRLTRNDAETILRAIL